MSLFKKKLKIGQEVAVIRLNYKTNKEFLEKGKVIAVHETIPNLQYSERIGVVFKGGKFESLDPDIVFTKWDEDYIKQEEE